MVTCISTPERLRGAFEEELVWRACVERMRRSQSKYVKTLAAKYRKEPDTISLASSGPSGLPVPEKSPSPEVVEIIEHPPQKVVMSQGEKDQYMKDMKKYVLWSLNTLISTDKLSRGEKDNMSETSTLHGSAGGKRQAFKSYNHYQTSNLV